MVVCQFELRHYPEAAVTAREVSHALCDCDVRLLAGATAVAQQANPASSQARPITLYAPEQHDLYDGLFNITAEHMVGGFKDPPGWNHMDTTAATVRPVGGTVDVNVNEIANRGTFVAKLKIPEGDLVLAIDRFHEFAPCQNGGIVAYLHEHGTDNVRLPGGVGLRARHAERQAAVSEIRDCTSW